MAAPLNSLPGVALPPYLLVNVAHVSLPDVATQGRQLFVDIEPPPSTIGSDHSSSDARSSQQEGSSSGFAFDRALGGIKATQQQQQQGTASDGKAGTVASVTQRGGNVVQLGPDALKPENAEATLAELDKLSSSRRRVAQANPAVKFRSLHNAQGGLLYDVRDDDGDGGGGGGGTSGLGAGSGSAADDRPPEPHHSVSQQDGAVVVTVEMPLLSSAAEAGVQVLGGTTLVLTAPGKYQLRVQLPHPVDDTRSTAKWHKGKHQLVLTFPATTEL